eukprot:12890010-Ditylum_brightwellii.AAC.1
MCQRYFCDFENKSANACTVPAKEFNEKNNSKMLAKKCTKKKQDNRQKWPLIAHIFLFKHKREKIVMASAVADGLNPIEVLKEIHSAAPVKGKRRHHLCCKSYGKI